jgi:hypothetical protein
MLIASVTVDVFETDKKSLVVRAQHFHQLASTPRQQLASNLVTAIRTHYNSFYQY